MDPKLQRETQNLVKSWAQYDPQMLRTYLVAGVEDPRINIQSILTRHFLVVAMFGARFERLMEDELRFATVLNWASTIFQAGPDLEDIAAIRHALDRGADDAEGISIPPFVSAAYRAATATATGKASPNYFDPLLRLPVAGQETANVQEALDTFRRAWQIALNGAPASGMSVLEPACGSVNDYRFFHQYGLARLMTYTGFDLCEANVRNARQLFPAARVLVGNAFGMPFSDAAFEHVVAHDLFEHLSIEAMELALAEVCRVTRRSLSLGFFNMHEGADHHVQPTDDYHWNGLSLPRIRERLEAQGFTVEALHIDTFLRWRFGCDQTHNKNAYTLFAERRQAERGSAFSRDEGAKSP